MKQLLVLFTIGMLVFSLAPVVLAENETSASDANTIIAEDTISTEETIPVETTSVENTETSIQDEEFMTNWDGTCGDMNCDEVKITDSGINPDSSFYFIDEFFDRFGDAIANREERVAEIKAMIEAGNYEAAHKALERYKEDAKKLEAESDPEKREEARRSAAAIKNALDEIKDDIPEEQQEDFYKGIIEKEKGLLTAVDISSKIKELCVQLAELDPVQYSKTCKDEGDSPAWKKKLNEDLTNEQRDEAKKFGDIMSRCFKSSGQDCACDDISFYDFSVACSKAAPLAIACDVKEDEDACYKLDNLNMPELPDYLQDVLDDIESKYSESKYDMHMPPECVEAGITDPKECGKIMIKEHAPIECKAALLKADVSNEREGREICDKIMFEKNAPQECTDKGITNPKECMKLMDNFKGPQGPGGFGAPGKNCMEIEDKMERLDCFENSVNNVGEQYGVGEKFQDGKGEITWQCKENRIHWPPDCERFMREEWPNQEKMQKEEYGEKKANQEDWRVKEKECAASCDLVNGWWDYSNGKCICKTNEGFEKEDNYDKGGEGCGDCASKCPGSSGTDCVNNQCVCLHEDSESQYNSGEGPGKSEDYNTPQQGTSNNGEPPRDDYYQEPPQDNYQEPEYSEPPQDNYQEPEYSEPEPAPEPTPMTGEAVSGFEEYWKKYR